MLRSYLHQMDTDVDETIGEDSHLSDDASQNLAGKLTGSYRHSDLHAGLRQATSCSSPEPTSVWAHWCNRTGKLSMLVQEVPSPQSAATSPTISPKTQARRPLSTQGPVLRGAAGMTPKFAWGKCSPQRHH